MGVSRLEGQGDLRRSCGAAATSLQSTLRSAQSSSRTTLAYRILRRWWRLALALTWGAGVAALTLTPDPSEISRVAEMPTLCLLCGSRGTADALLNIVLFVPLGLTLGGLRRGLRKAVWAGLLCSAGIELGQTLLPGRHPTISDLVWNIGGAGLGVWLFRRMQNAVVLPTREGGERGGSPGLRRWSSELTWGLAVAVGLVLAGAFMTPQPTKDDYWGQWTPDLGHMPQYGGRILEASINGIPMPTGRLGHEGTDEALLVSPWRVDGTFLAGPPPSEVAPILSIYDGHQFEVLLLGAHGDDLVFRERNLAHRLRFDSPDVRLVRALRPLTMGDTASISASRIDGDTCLQVGALQQCGVGVSPARSWGLLLYVEGPREWLRGLVDVGWLGILFLPIGFFARTGLGTAGGAAMGLMGMFAAVVATPFIGGPWYEVAACLAGVWTGRAILLLLRKVASQSAPAASIASSV